MLSLREAARTPILCIRRMPPNHRKAYTPHTTTSNKQRQLRGWQHPQCDKRRRSMSLVVQFPSHRAHPTTGTSSADHTTTHRRMLEQTSCLPCCPDANSEKQGFVCKIIEQTYFKLSTSIPFHFLPSPFISIPSTPQQLLVHRCK